MKCSSRTQLLAASAVALGLALCRAHAGNGGGLQHIKVSEGQVIFEQIGQGLNLTPITGAQVGYLTYLKGIDFVFAGTVENESTALFTFFQDFPLTEVRANGPLRVVTREGTTTLYLNGSPSGDFSNADSFRAGVPILTWTVRQQVVIDTVTQLFTVVNQDTIIWTGVFSVNGARYQIGKPGDLLRTLRTGRLNTPGLSPVGWFAGYTVGAEKADLNP